MDIAIYSRKSKLTDKGESMQNQIQMCKDYCNTHFTVSNFYIYEDEGFSGGTIDRPQYKQMINDARKRKFQAVVCYRLDRISRNVLDFSKTLEELNDNSILFISISEQFNTSTPMGRAMMYIASVFAQLERETIAERIRDNMHELAKTGRWLGGVPPLGFKSERLEYIDKDFKERSLVQLNPVNEEMKKVDFFYDKYLELGSIHQLRKYLIKNNKRTSNDAYYSLRVLSDILRNPAYVKADSAVKNYLEGKGIAVAGIDRLNGNRAILIYNKKGKKSKNEMGEWIAAVAKHNGYVSAEKWLKAQHQLDKNSMELPRAGTSDVALLSGILRCEKCGSPMNVTYGRKRKDGNSPHYYACNMKTISCQDKCQNPNANGIDIDNTVISKLTELAASNKETLLDELESLKRENKHLDSVDMLDELKNKKKRLLDEINNLIGEVSKSAPASKYILPQIEARDQEIKNLDEEISRLEKEREEKEKESEGFDLVINNILNFSSTITRLSNKEKKYFLQTIIDKVYWDGESGEVAISLLTDLTDKKKLKNSCNSNCNSNSSNHTSNLSQFYPASSCQRDETAIVLYQEVSVGHKYKDYPEDTLGQKIRKQRFINGLTAKELARLCGRTEYAIYAYESDVVFPHCAIMEKICAAMGVPVQYFKDDYYNFVLWDGYTGFLRKWRKENTNKHDEVKKILGVSYDAYLSWEKGGKINREIFIKIKEKLGL